MRKQSNAYQPGSRKVSEAEKAAPAAEVKSKSSMSLKNNSKSFKPKTKTVKVEETKPKKEEKEVKAVVVEIKEIKELKIASNLKSKIFDMKKFKAVGSQFNELGNYKILLKQFFFDRKCEKNKEFQVKSGRRQNNYNNNNNNNNDFSKGTKKQPSTGQYDRERKQGYKKNRGSGGGGGADGGFTRKAKTDAERTMEQQAHERKNILKTQAELDLKSFSKQLKFMLNKMTPETQNKITAQVTELYDSLENEEQDKVFQDIYFSKASYEERYAPMYVAMLQKVSLTSTRMKEAFTSAYPNDKFPKSYNKKFNKLLLCKDVIGLAQNKFQEFFKNQSDKEFEGLDEDDKMEKQAVHKKRLMGNLKFAAEMIKNSIIMKKTAFHIMDGLLNTTIDDDNLRVTIFEGACKFLVAVGNKIDRHDYLTSDNVKKVEEQKKFENILSRLIEIQNNDETSVRIKMIIKNALCRRETEWITTTDLEGPKTLKQVKRDHYDDLNSMGGDSDPRKNPSSPNKRRGNKQSDFDRRDKAGTKAQTGSRFDNLVSSSASQPQNKGGRDGNQQEDKKQERYPEVSDDEIKKTLLVPFLSWHKDQSQKIDVKPFQILKKKGVRQDRMLCCLINKMLDSIELHSSFVGFYKILAGEKIFSVLGTQDGFSMLFKLVPDIESDFPFLPKLIAEFIYEIFIVGKSDLHEVVMIDKPTNEEDLECWFPDIFIKIIAVFIQYVFDKAEGSEEEKQAAAKKMYDEQEFKIVLKDIKENVMGADYIFETELKGEFDVNEFVQKMVETDFNELFNLI